MVSGNTISDPYSAGIYAASASDLSIVGNTISGQVDANDVTLPKVHANHIDSIVANGTGIRVISNSSTNQLSITSAYIGSSAASVSSIVGFYASGTVYLRDIMQSGASASLRWYSDINGTTAYQTYNQVGDIAGIYRRANSTSTYALQQGFWPTY